ncbi:MAG: HypC/HybG/HupF family hydrogenase formation chaperone [Candidatus Berkiella sp.]
MCLAIPCKIVQIDEPNSLLMHAQVEFGGIQKRISLAYTPEAKVGDYVIVHVGFAISIIDEQAAQTLLNALDQYSEKNDEIPS